MKYLLDTHTFIWSVMDSSKLSESVKEIIQNPDNEIFVSGISFWEIAIKTQIGKMKFENFNIRQDGEFHWYWSKVDIEDIQLFLIKLKRAQNLIMQK